MNKGFEFEPVFDRIHGVFCWMRIADQETTLWEVGQYALESVEYCQNATPHEIDETARLAFDAMESE